MKNILCLFILTLLSSCNAYKIEETRARHVARTLDFTVTKPADWRAFRDHYYVSYTPNVYGDRLFESTVSIQKLDNDGSHSSLKEFVDYTINEYVSKTQTSNQFSTTTNHLGTVYINITDSFWRDNLWKSYHMYFEHNGEYYVFYFSSFNYLYFKNFDDAMSILESITFKETS